MSNSGSSFRCPVCRARQTMQTECRRCQADLSLVVRALRRVEYLLARRNLLIGANDSAERLRTEQELMLLSPQQLPEE